MERIKVMEQVLLFNSIQCQFINSTEHIIAHNIQNIPDTIKQNYQQLLYLAHRGQAIHATLRMHESPVPIMCTYIIIKSNNKNHEMHIYTI